MKKAITEIRGMDTAELRARLNDLRKEQFGLKFRGSPEQVKQTARRTAIRRTIARITMVLADRDAGVAAPSAAKPSPAPVGKPKPAKAQGGKSETKGKPARSAKSGAK